MNNLEIMKATLPRVRVALQRHFDQGYAAGVVALIGRGEQAETVVIGN
jgi:hypothetical protein